KIDRREDAHPDMSPVPRNRNEDLVGRAIRQNLESERAPFVPPIPWAPQQFDRDRGLAPSRHEGLTDNNGAAAQKAVPEAVVLGESEPVPVLEKALVAVARGLGDGGRGQPLLFGPVKD